MIQGVRCFDLVGLIKQLDIKFTYESCMKASRATNNACLTGLSRVWGCIKNGAGNLHSRWSIWLKICRYFGYFVRWRLRGDEKIVQNVVKLWKTRHLNRTFAQCCTEGTPVLLQDWDEVLLEIINRRGGGGSPGWGSRSGRECRFHEQVPITTTTSTRRLRLQRVRNELQWKLRQVIEY